MLKSKARWFALVMGAFPVALATASQGSTLTQVVYPLAQPNEGIALSDLLRQDPLGYTCIDEAQIDIAFFASGKGARLPQTCLPEPCQAALSQAQLARLIGRAPNPEEWDEYYARYAETCRTETTAFGDAPGAGPGDAEGFWAPIISASNPVTNGFLTQSGLNNRVVTGGSTGGGASVPLFSSGGGSSSTSSGTTTLASATPSSPGTGGTGGGSGDSSTSTGGGGGGANVSDAPSDEPRGQVPDFETPPGGGFGDGPGGGGGGGGVSNEGGGPGGGGGGGNGDSSWNENPNLPAVPLPPGIWMVLTGVAAFGGLRYRKSRKSA